MAYIENQLLQSFRKWFHEYVISFFIGPSHVRENMALKKKHTMRVCEEILRLGRDLGINGDSLRFAEITALFHDVGRFEQYARYRTFVDHRSENHAELSVRILKKYHVLDGLKDSLKALVYRIVSYHNRPFLPEGETKRCLFYTKLLRDADKLDIWKILTRYYRREDSHSNRAIELDLPNTSQIADKVMDAIVNKRVVDINDVKSLNDFKVLQIGWIFDVNFQTTLDTILARNYLADTIASLPGSGKAKRIEKIVNHYVENEFSEENQRIDIC
ncbi:MAG: HD family phosphohydrolase [Proteobacteria bacterium]|nr:MAG: HD family phosphohydrolase [Pseudomonadota bacterium]PIE67835.1 MAG: HD family phosphohydrolase [Deltaproteobacteria bacterium]